MVVNDELIKVLILIDWTLIHSRYDVGLASY